MRHNFCGIAKSWYNWSSKGIGLAESTSPLFPRAAIAFLIESPLPSHL
jgi:hypothetical protein